jgi:hypothetical protein
MLALAFLFPFGDALYLITQAAPWITALGEIYHDWYDAFCILLIGSAVLFARADNARKRGQSRAQVIAGISAIMSSAHVELAPLSRDDEAGAEIALFWKPRRENSLIAVIVLLLALATTFLGATLLEAQFPKLPWLPILAFATLIEVATFFWWIQRYQYRPNRVIATSEGVRSYRSGQQVAFVPWDEARLFEIWSALGNNGARYGYALMSEHAIIEWPDFTAENAPSADGVDPEEMYSRLRSLIAYVMERARLIPRTCDPKLAADDIGDASQRAPRWYLVFAVSVMGAFAAAPLIAAVTALFAPLTTSLPLNIAFAALCSVWVVIFIRIEIEIVPQALRLYGVLSRTPKHPDVGTFLPSLLPTMTTFQLRERPLWRNKGFGIIALALSISMAYVLMRSTSDFPASSASSWAAWRHYGQIGGWITMFFTLIIAAAGLFAIDPRFIADTEALRSQRGRLREMLTWKEITDLEVIVNARGKAIAYRASGADRQIIRWSAHARWADTTPPIPHDANTTPSAIFAAAIAQRAGIIPRVEYE